MTSMSQGNGCRGHCESGELLKLLAKKLESRGLDYQLVSYPGSASEDAPIEEIVITNSAARERGEIRICDDGGVTWEYFGTIDEAGINKILDDATNALRATGLRIRPRPEP
jgi:hypothetical protein